MFRSMGETSSSSLLAAERRRAQRAWVPGIAVLRSGAQPPSVWRVANLSTGGVSLVGGGAVLLDRVSMDLHVAGFPNLELETRLVRRELATQNRRRAPRFIGGPQGQRRNPPGEGRAGTPPAAR